jgi:hypothetical protein
MKSSKGTVTTGLPPTLEVVPLVQQKFRFIASASTASVVNIGQLIGIMGNLSTSTTSLSSIMGSVKLHSVTVWPPGGTTANNIAAILWNSGQSGQMEDKENDGSVPTGITVTKALTFTPPPGTLAGFWINSADSAANLFTVICETGSIIDVRVSGRFSNTFPPVVSTVAGATVGKVYFQPLDGASGKLIPTSLLFVT